MRYRMSRATLMAVKNLALHQIDQGWVDGKISLGHERVFKLMLIRYGGNTISFR